MHSLKHLHIISPPSQVEYVFPDGWEFCTSLSTLDLRHNRLQLLDGRTLRQLPSLTVLRLDDNRVSHVEPGGAAFDGAPKLEELNLDGNQVGGDDEC